MLISIVYAFWINIGISMIYITNMMQNKPISRIKDILSFSLEEDDFLMNVGTSQVKLPHSGMPSGGELCFCRFSFITTDIPSSWCTSI